jgi:hypothetical protein
MVKHNSRGARLTALALATGTLVVAATGSAGAAPVSVPDVFGGSAKGTAIHIEINLPVAIPAGPLGTITGIVQDISLTEGLASKDVTKVASVAKAVLGNGTLAPLNLVSESSLSGAKQSDSQSLVAIPANPLISGGVGTITSSVAPDNATSALTSTSRSTLLGLEVGLPALPELPVGLDLGALVDQLNATVDEVEGTVTGTVDTAVSTLNDLSGGVTAPVAEEIKVVTDTLTNTLDNLQGVVANLANNPSLLSIGLLESTNTITRKGSMVESKATSAVGDISALGGLVTLEAVKTESFSTANGLKGAAAADTLTTVVGLKVADLLELDLTDKGLSGSLLGEALPAAAKDAVNTAIGALNGVLATAGVEIVYGKKTSSVAADGSTAASSSEGVGIVVNPPVLNLAKPLLAVQLVPAGTAVNAARLAKPVTPRVTTPGKRPLPRTGAELPLFAVLGSGVAAAALVARRRNAEA